MGTKSGQIYYNPNANPKAINSTALLQSFDVFRRYPIKMANAAHFSIIQQMDYMQVSLPGGDNEYFRPRFEVEDGDEVEIEEYLSLEAFYLDPLQIPDLHDCPLSDGKKLDSTLDLTDDVPTLPPSSPMSSSPSPSPSPISDSPLTMAPVVTFSEKTIARYRAVFRGSKDDTVQLNINFKTLLVHYFRELRMLNELNQYEEQHLLEFSERVPSFNSLMLLLQDREENAGIRRQALELFSSKECIRRIMKGRSRMKTKLQMIKFVEKVRMNILAKGKGYKWKDIIKQI